MRLLDKKQGGVYPFTYTPSHSTNLKAEAFGLRAVTRRPRSQPLIDKPRAKRRASLLTPIVT